jgi:hypothetical protein
MMAKEVLAKVEMGAYLQAVSQAGSRLQPQITAPMERRLRSHCRKTNFSQKNEGSSCAAPTPKSTWSA